YVRKALCQRDQLPTETKLEWSARRRRCRALRQLLRRGAVQTVNDLVTLNLDFRQLAVDLIRETDDGVFLMKLQERIERITVLDPTCGSGAFLLAALAILEDLTVTRRERDSSRFRFPRDPDIDRLMVRWVILVRSLHGMDLMPEAVELCKMRLYLKF